ncbi:efflux transporter periplasmic adaptor subunit, partial [Rhizobium ruizarguesonis]
SVAPPPPPTRVTPPTQPPVPLSLELTGHTAPLTSVDLEARVQGSVPSLYSQACMPVMQGPPLF